MKDGFLSIGALARRGTVPVRTLRFWSDQGLIPVARRSGAGYRLYGPEAIAKLDLVRTLRELGFGLEAIGAALARHRTPAEIAVTHMHALDARMRELRAQRAVLSVIARRDPSLQEITIMTAIAKMSAAERQALIDDFVARAFAGLAEDAPGRQIGEAMRNLPPELPEEPSAEVLAAWIELGELVASPSFATRVREMAVAGAQPPDPTVPRVDMRRLQELAADALARGIEPDGERARSVVAQLMPDMDRADSVSRKKLAAQLATFTDERVERYWSLLGVLHGRPQSPPRAPAMRWLIRALEA